jgi:phenylalanyl-tRNA synthetase beta chain
MVTNAEGDLMPTITVIFDDLELLVGQKLPRNSEKLTDLLAFVKGEVESVEGKELAIEIKDGNRPDLWGVEGIARALRGALGLEEGLKQYQLHGPSLVEVTVDPELEEVRPYIACAVARDVHLTDNVIRGFMHLQDKLDQTYGRKRQRTSIGLYDYSLIHPPLRYTVANPTELSFTPLESSSEMNLKEILATHPKGLEYGQILRGFEKWPILLDAEDCVLSFPPIINSDDAGKITETTKDVLIEVTGTDHQTVLNTLTLVTISVADRGGKVFTTQIQYPYANISKSVTPNFATSAINVDLSLINRVIGIKLNQAAALKYLKRARYDVTSVNDQMVNVTVPCYRVDIMHPIDVIEDILIMYGYNNIEPRWPQLVTFGEISNLELTCDLVREIMVGLGFQEILSFSMTTPQHLFTRMNLPPTSVLEIANPLNERFTCLRSWLLPSLMQFVASNTHVSYPQRIFEVGDCIQITSANNTNVKEVKKLACLTIHSKASFSEIKAVLDALLLNIGIEYRLDVSTHCSFIEGRVGRIMINGKAIGFIGELNPTTLEAWELENPTIGFEVDLNELFDLI